MGINKNKTNEPDCIGLDILNFVEKIKIMNTSLNQSTMQLTDSKKEHARYNLTDSVIDVGQGQYGISYGNDYLYTYGIEPCCGVVLCDGTKYILFHLDGSTSPEQVKKITDNFGFESSSKVLICPGVTCGIPGSFRYQELAKLYINMGYEVNVSRINGTFGYVKVAGTQVEVGSILTKKVNIYDLTAKGFNK